MTTPAELLTPFAVLPEWLVAASDPERVAAALSEVVPQLVEGKLRIVDADAGRARLKKDRWTIRYDLKLVAPDASEQRLRLLATLVPPGQPEPSRAESSLSLGTPDWRCWLPGLRLDLELEPPDEDLPTLPLLTDPERSRALLEDAIGSNPSYAGLRIASCQPNVVRYSPGSRCTILYTLGYEDEGSAGPELVVAKTYHGDKGQVAWAGMTAVWSTPLAEGNPVRVAEPLAFLPEVNVLVQGPLREERTLKQLITEALATGTAEARAELDRGIAQAADGLAALHGCGATPQLIATWDEELAEVRQTLDRLAGPLPETAGVLEPLLEELASRASTAPADPIAPAHRSFRPAQLLLADGEAAIIDFDGFCRAEPGLDVGLFRSTVRDIALSQLTDDADPLPDQDELVARAATAEELCEAFLARYESHRPISRERIALWEALFLLTVLLHSWTKVKPSRLRHALVLVGRHIDAQDLSPVSG